MYLLIPLQLFNLRKKLNTAKKKKEQRGSQSLSDKNERKTKTCRATGKGTEKEG